jgi:D-amino peptidase
LKEEGKSMKVYVLVDAEGISGVVNNDLQVKPDSPRYEETRRLFMSDLNAAIEGAFDGGADDIVVYDMHYWGTNVILGEIHPKAKVVLGKPPKIDPPAGIDERVDALFMVGYHAMAEVEGALLSHTYTLDMKALRLNGVLMGEIGLEAAIAGCKGVPLAFLSGDDAAMREAEDLLGDLEGACVKRGTGPKSALCLPLKKSYSLIHKKAKAAAKRLEDFTPYRVEPPYRIEIEFYGETSAAKAAAVKGVRREGERAISLIDGDLASLWERFLSAYTAG